MTRTEYGSRVILEAGQGCTLTDGNETMKRVDIPIRMEQDWQEIPWQEAPEESDRTLRERVADLEERNEMLTECILEISELLYS